MFLIHLAFWKKLEAVGLRVICKYSRLDNVCWRCVYGKGTVSLWQIIRIAVIFFDFYDIFKAVFQPNLMMIFAHWTKDSDVLKAFTVSVYVSYCP